MKSKVNRVVKCVAFFGLALSTQLVGANGAAVSHSHNGRTHSHPLPSEGLSHSHGAGNAASSPNTGGQWIDIGGTTGIGGFGGIDFYLKRGSLEIGKGYLKVMGQSVDRISHRVELSHYVVSFQDCKNQAGIVENYTIRGRLIGQTDFVFGGRSMASYIADVICGAGAKYIR